MSSDIYKEILRAKGVVYFDEEDGLIKEIGIVEHDESTYEQLRLILGEKYNEIKVVISGKSILQSKDDKNE